MSNFLTPEYQGYYFLVSTYPDGGQDFDGPHSEMEGVIKAKEITERIFGNKPNYKDAIYSAIQVLPIPDKKVKINEQAADLMRRTVDSNRKCDDCGSSGGYHRNSCPRGEG